MAAQKEGQSSKFYRTPSQFTCDGVDFPGSLSRRDLKETVVNFECRKDDVFIVTYPRSGTHWTTEIASLVLTRGNKENAESVSQYVRVPPLEMRMSKVKMFRWLLIFFIRLKNLLPMSVQRYFKLDNLFEEGVNVAQDAIQYYNSLPTSTPRVIKTHMPQDFFPSQAFEKGPQRPRVLYVARNPKDMLVSYYHLYNIASVFGYYTGPWSEFFNMFINKKLVYGDWFDHVLGWWKYQDEENILFLKYEDMKRDLQGTIRKIASFLQVDLSDEQVAVIEDHCSFGSMKKNPNVNFERELGMHTKKTGFIRKGIVGDWENFFTIAQSRQFEEIYDTKMKDTGLTFEW